ncbi:MFS transporter [Pelotomaculum propionicicum]|uniref:Putative glycolipid permease LtaA n=1 Tax=Pelotomaculum propionicicum TaxID=258475 RepID=A0A4Y7RWG2_9FIRM|nr:MFS transporter [Pelotomaculum propionicicum]NLI13872.1 MFS transporter [Peptococcaceae bacterium]TEB13110.1 putative glycolipid permease LtaA [Pelotomaculum propionicicum]
MHELKAIFTSKRELGLILMLFFMEFTRGAFFLTFLPLYAVNYLGISVAAAGLAVSAHYLVETLFKGAAGWQLDRIGYPVLLAGLLLGLGSLLFMKFCHSPAVLLIGSALFGLGVSPVWLAVISGVAPVQLKERAARMGIVFAVWLFGSGGGPVAINFLIARDYNLAFWLLIALWGGALAVTLLLLPFMENKADESSGFSFWTEVGKMAENQTFKKILMPGMFLQTMTGGLMLPLLPLYAQNKIGLSPNQYALLLLIGGAAAAVSFLPMGRLADRIRLKTLLGTGFGMSAVSLALFPTAHNAVTSYGMAALVGFSYAMVLPSWNNLLAKVISPERQATGWGVFSTIEGMGIAVGPALGGIVAKSFGISTALFLGAVLLAMMSCFYFLYPIEKLFTHSLTN